MDVASTINHLRSKGLTYCGRPGKLETLYELVQTVERNNIPGI